MLLSINARKKDSMSQCIHKLDEKVINKIAAGEVIESPSSVIKELVENSLDAKAKNIYIEVKNSGLQLIKVEDDGHGMSKDDAIFCFERYATSKIKNFDDLLCVDSMGFRGEALASIAAVSKLDLKTSIQDIATCLTYENGKIIKQTELARTKGTSIEAKYLFYNVPVRKKFLKSLANLNSEIIKIVIYLSLAYPHVGFTLVLNDKKIISIQSCDLDIKKSFFKRIKELLKEDFTLLCEKVDFEFNNIKIFGFLGFPTYARKTKSLQYLIVNNRVIYRSLFSKFIKDAYSNRISENDHPIYALHIQLPKNLIDINVHPQKKEIKIADNVFVKEIIKKAFDKTFEKSQKVDRGFIDTKLNFTQIDTSKSFSNTSSFEEENIFKTFEKQQIFEKVYDVNIDNFLQVDRFVFLDSYPLKGFIHLEDEEKLVLVDLSALFAYILYEKIKNKKISSLQNLLVPINIFLDVDDLNFVEENLKTFLELGFDIRIISQNAISIDAIDEMIDQNNIKNLFFLILEDLKKCSKSEMINKVYEKKLLQSILQFSKKKNYTKQDAVELLKKLKNLKNIDFDLFGNPFIMKLTKTKIEKIFKR